MGLEYLWKERACFYIGLSNGYPIEILRPPLLSISRIEETDSTDIFIVVLLFREHTETYGKAAREHVGS